MSNANVTLHRIPVGSSVGSVMSSATVVKAVVSTSVNLSSQLTWKRNFTISSANEQSFPKLKLRRWGRTGYDCP